jgi:phosphoribosylanthranilate isomerase
MFIKICGITRLADALHAVTHGADALGFVFWPKSPRYIAPERAGDIIAALPPTLLTVGVFVNEPVDRIREVVALTGAAAVQLHGDERPADAGALGWPLMRAVKVDAAGDVYRGWPPHTTFLVDAVEPERRGGTGTMVDWQKAAAVARKWPVVLAGGLTPSNVENAIGIVRPFGVDVSSGVEDAPGVKNPAKVAEFLANARRAFSQR